MVGEEEFGGEEWSGKNGRIEESEGINYKVDTFNRGLKSNHHPVGIGKERPKSTTPVLEPSCCDKDCPQSFGVPVVCLFLSLKTTQFSVLHNFYLKGRHRRVEKLKGKSKMKYDGNI